MLLYLLVGEIRNEINGILDNNKSASCFLCNLTACTNISDKEGKEIP